MKYLITFLEGFTTFISPCMLPLLPLYVSYFAGGADKKHKVFLRALCFVPGMFRFSAAVKKIIPRVYLKMHLVLLADLLSFLFYWVLLREQLEAFFRITSGL